MGSREQRVVFDTDERRIVGDLQLPEESYRSRLSDLLNRQGFDFIPLTDVEVTRHDGGPVQSHPFLAVAKSHIQLAHELGD